MLKAVALSLLSCTMVPGAGLARLIAAEASVPAGVPGEDPGFKPVVEAPLPDGFPTYTPVGKIEVKHYPPYRKAETSGRVAFWTLFEHITRAGVEMTAPVEMTYQKDGPPVGKEQSMAFLYGNRSIGTPGQNGNVEVVDVPAATVVSIGMRGRRSDEVLVQAEQRLRDWLAASKGKYEQNGPVRVMGYNSPFIASDRQFYEVQITVREG
jgi:hypothetical protein